MGLSRSSNLCHSPLKRFQTLLLIDPQLGHSLHGTKVESRRQCDVRSTRPEAMRWVVAEANPAGPSSLSLDTTLTTGIWIFSLTLLCQIRTQTHTHPQIHKPHNTLIHTILVSSRSLHAVYSHSLPSPHTSKRPCSLPNMSVSYIHHVPMRGPPHAPALALWLLLWPPPAPQSAVPPLCGHQMLVHLW